MGWLFEDADEKALRLEKEALKLKEQQLANAKARKKLAEQKKGFWSW